MSFAIYPAVLHHWVQQNSRSISVHSGSTTAQGELDKLLQDIETSTSTVESQWHKLMELREENWQAFRCRLFEEVVMYSTLPIDAVR